MVSLIIESSNRLHFPRAGRCRRRVPDNVRILSVDAAVRWCRKAKYQQSATERPDRENRSPPVWRHVGGGSWALGVCSVGRQLLFWLITSCKHTPHSSSDLLTSTHCRHASAVVRTLTCSRPCYISSWFSCYRSMSKCRSAILMPINESRLRGLRKKTFLTASCLSLSTSHPKLIIVLV